MGNEARFVVELEDKMSGAATQASGSLQDLRQAIATNSSELAAMNKAMRVLKTDSKASGDEIAALQAKIDAKKAAILASTRELVKMNDAFVQGGEAASEAAEQIEELQESVQAAVDPVEKLDQALSSEAQSSSNGAAELKVLQNGIQSSLGPLGEQITMLRAVTSWLGKSGMAGAAAGAGVALVALAAVIIASVGVALGKAIKQMASFALASAGAAREQRLMLQGITGSAAEAKNLQQSISAVSSKVAISGEQVESLGQTLASAGLRGDQFRQALEAASIASSAGGSAAEQAFLQAATAAAKAGQPIDELAKDVRDKFGATAKAQMLGFQVQMTKLKENTGALFADVNIEPFLRALSKITAMFDKNTATGKALKTLVETLLDPLFESAETIGPIVESFFDGIVIGALHVGIAVLKVRNAFLDAFGDDVKTDIDWLQVAMYAGAAAVLLVVGALTALTVVLGVVAVSVTIALLPFIVAASLVMAAIALVVAAVVGLAYVFLELYNYLSGLDFAAIGSSIIQGLVDGITAGADLVIGAVKGIIDRVKGTFSGELKINSPSKVTEEFGLNTTEGFAGGVEGGSDKVEGAIKDMVQLPAQAGLEAASSSMGVGSTSVTINIHAPSGDAGDIARAVKQVVSELFEHAAITLGAPLEEAT